MSKWHNSSKIPIYYVWRNMMSRCYNVRNTSYKNYGKRGIKVCNHWHNYDNFVEDMGNPPKNKSLERKNTNMGYDPINCKWATLKQQLNNQRRNHRITYKGRTLNINQWSKILKINTDTLCRRINIYKLPLHKAMKRSLIKSWRHGTRQGYEVHACRCSKCKKSNTLRHRIRRAA